MAGRRKSQTSEVIGLDFSLFFEALGAHSARECAIIGVAYLEESLMSLLRTAFISGETSKGLFKEGGILGQLSHCNKIAYCLGLIPEETLKNVDRMGSIRNIFAHNYRLTTFDSAEVREECDNITIPKGMVMPDETRASIMDNPRSRFVHVAHHTALRLLLLADAKAED